MSEIKKVGVLGCGLMGRGIAQVAASTGHTTIVRDVTDEFNDKGKAAIEKSLAKFVEKEKMSAADRDATLDRLIPCPCRLDPSNPYGKAINNKSTK